MLKVWGRTNSINVQKVMWAIGELRLAHERIDAGGAFGKNKEPRYLAMNPNGLVPVLEDDGFILWESNSIVRYLAATRDRAGVLEPRDPRRRARAQMWMDWQLSVLQPAQHALFWGLVRTAPEARDPAAIAASREKTVAAMTILDHALAETAFLAGDAFSYGDIPAALNTRRSWALVPDHPPLPNLRRWYDAVAARPPFQEHVEAVPMT